MFKKQIVKNLICLVLVLIIVIGVFPANAASSSEAKVFEDVKDGYWAKNSIDYTSSLGYINGYGKTFGINDPIREGQYVAILCRMLGRINQNPLTTEEPARELGIIKKGETFNVTGNLKRDDMATYTIRAFELLNSDTEYPDYLEAYKGMVGDYEQLDTALKTTVLKCVEKGLIAGIPNGNYDPNGESTRAQAAAVIHRILSQDERNKTMPIFATPDPEFEAFMNNKEVASQYVTTMKIEKVIDGRIIWNSQSGESGLDSGVYGLSLLPVYYNKDINKEAYEAVKAMVNSARESKEHYVMAYYANNRWRRWVAIKYYSNANQGMIDALYHGLFGVDLEVDPIRHRDDYDNTIVQKKDSYYKWGTGNLYDSKVAMDPNINLSSIKWKTEEYTKPMNKLFKVIYGDKIGQVMYDYAISEYTKIGLYSSGTVVPLDGDTVESDGTVSQYINIKVFYHSIYKNLEIQNLNYIGSPSLFSTNKLK